MSIPWLTRTPPLAQEIMTTKLITVRPETDVSQAVHLLLKHGVSGMPVVDADGKYLGIFSEKCCMKVLTATASLVRRPGMSVPKAMDFMTTRLLKLSPDQDVFEAIGLLLKHHVSGAPVCDEKGEFLGNFSEKTSMSVLTESAYDGIPSGEVRAFMDSDRGRLIDPDMDLLSIARVFIETPYRRLPIVRRNRVIGQISRRDVLKSSQILETIIRTQVEAAGDALSMESEARAYVDAHRQLPSTSVSAFMDTRAETISDDCDLLGIAYRFLSTPFRRLPVIRQGCAVGQVSRRDVLTALFKQIEPPAATSESGILYLSATRDRSEMPNMN